MAQSFAAGGARRRASGDWRAERAPVIEGTAEVISRRPRPVAGQAALQAPAAEPRWGAALHAANSNRRPAPRPRPRVWLWTSLGLQTAAALAGLAVLVLVVFPSGMTRAPSPPPLPLAAAGTAR